MRIAVLAAISTLVGALAAPTTHAQTLATALGNAEAGASVFNRDCAFCHQIGPEARDRVGPQLNRIYDRGAGSIDGFGYSRGLSRMGVDGLVWTFDTLDAYIANPRALVSGTRRSYRGLQDETERHDLLAFLRAYSDQPENMPGSAPTAIATLPELSYATLTIEGDREYGEYLSAECTTCHQINGTDAGIPAIIGWPAEDFVVAMHAYKQGLRPHPVMQMMASRLDDEQIAALAAFFETAND